MGAIALFTSRAMHLRQLVQRDGMVRAGAQELLPVATDRSTGETVEITRRGELVAVLISCREYKRLTSTFRPFSETYAEFVQDVDLDAPAIDPDELFAGVRDDEQGRRVEP